MSALPERDPPRMHVGRILLRRGGIVVLCVALVPVVAYFLARDLHRSYTAEAVVVVPSGAGPKGPGNAQEADKLAVTYAAVIPKDDRVLKRIARDIHARESLVRRELRVVTDQGTSLIRLRFTDPRRDVAIAGAAAVVRALTSPVAVTPSIAPRSIAPVRGPTTPAKSSRAARTVPIGIVLGLVLGLILLAAWERADARIDDVASLKKEAGCPAMAVGDLSSRSMMALLQRWEALAGRAAPRIALVASAAAAESAAVAVAHRLHSAAEQGGTPIAIERGWSAAADNAQAHSLSTSSTELGPVHSGAGVRRDRTALLVGAAPGSDVAGEPIALDSDFVVLVASPGTRVRDVRAAVTLLEQFGVSPGWALLAERPRLTGARRAPRLDTLLKRRRGNGGSTHVASGVPDKTATEDTGA